MTGVYDHAAAEFVSKVANVVSDPFVPDPDVDELVAAKSLSGCDPVICHLGDDAWNCLLLAKTTGMIIRVSTRGYSQIEHAPAVDSSGRFLLHVVAEARLVSEADWGLILTTLSTDVARREFVRNGQPSAIRHFFIRELPLKLAALTALCQAFLASSAASGVHATDPNYAMALDVMGWRQMSARQDARDLITLAAKQSRLVARQSWWRGFLVDEDSDASLVFEEIAREWSGKENWEAVRKLLGNLGIVPRLTRGIKEEPITADVVSEAYIALSKALTGEKK